MENYVFENLVIYFVLLLHYLYQWMLEIKFDNHKARGILIALWVMAIGLILGYPIYLGGWYLLLLISSYVLIIVSFLLEPVIIEKGWAKFFWSLWDHFFNSKFFCWNFVFGCLLCLLFTFLVYLCKKLFFWN